LTTTADASRAYRDFTFPLNVFMHILTHEEGDVHSLHYALFDRDDEPIAAAQERSTELLFSRLPPPPARVLEAGIGLGTTLARLTRAGYDAVGITPDAQQVAMVRARFGDSVRALCAAFETFADPAAAMVSTDREPFDVIVFQESSQYIESNALFANARRLAPRVVVLDEFALRPATDAAAPLHSLAGFLAAAEQHGFRKTEELDLTAQAAPTIDYFTQRFPRYAAALASDLGVTAEQLQHLVDNGVVYRERYRNGGYGYRLLQFAQE
jgi:SAM-dependent methyltransferase